MLATPPSTQVEHLDFDSSEGLDQRRQPLLGLSPPDPMGSTLRDTSLLHVDSGRLSKDQLCPQYIPSSQAG